MTPEQNEQWRKAFNPLDYLDFHALSDDGLSESNSRLASWAVPKWAVDLRRKLIHSGWHEENKEMWVPDFALRSEVALAGISIEYPFYTEAERAYQQLFVGFAAEALRPLVEHANQGNRHRKKAYKPVVKLYQLCERCTRMDQELIIWPKHLEPFPKRALNEFLLRFPGCQPRRNELETREAFWARYLSVDLLGAITHFLKPGGVMQGEPSNDWNILTTIGDLGTLYAYSTEGTRTTKRNYMDLIATAYLTALEAECPPPHWLELRRA